MTNTINQINDEYKALHRTFVSINRAEGTEREALLASLDMTEESFDETINSAQIQLIEAYATETGVSFEEAEEALIRICY